MILKIFRWLKGIKYIKSDRKPGKHDTWCIVGIMLVHHLRCFPNIKSATAQRIVFTGKLSYFSIFSDAHNSFKINRAAQVIIAGRLGVEPVDSIVGMTLSLHSALSQWHSLPLVTLPLMPKSSTVACTTSCTPTGSEMQEPELSPSLAHLLS